MYRIRLLPECDALACVAPRRTFGVGYDVKWLGFDNSALARTLERTPKVVPRSLVGRCPSGRVLSWSTVFRAAVLGGRGSVTGLTGPTALRSLGCRRRADPSAL
jgi:hypothetical protein